MSTNKAKPDWLDTHLEIVGVSDDQADRIKDHVRARLAPLPTLTEARELGHNAAVAGFDLDCNPWLKDSKAGQHKDAWNNGFDDFRDRSHPQQELAFI